MNIFVLDKDPKIAAMLHIDKHVRKQIVESAQMLSTAVRANNPGEHPIYKTAYPKHPCTLACTNSRYIYGWTLSLMEALSEEFEYRFGKSHKSAELIPYLKDMVSTIPSVAREFAQAMPDEYKDKCPVKAYRAYYRAHKMRDKNNKPMDFWTNRERPEWLNTLVQ